MSTYSFRRIFNPHIIAMLPTLLGLTSCSSLREYPEHWSPITPVSAVGSCPAIAGLYNNSGDSPEPHTGRACYTAGEEENCTSLTYNLLSDIPHYSWYKASPSWESKHVRVNQSAADTIEVTLFDRDVHTLSLAARDFTCGPEGITLKIRSALTIFLISNASESEMRTFNVADDGSLVMKSLSRVVGHHTVFPVAGTDVHWVKWKKVQ